MEAVIQGLLLAAGAGSRMGRPKGLVRTPDGEPWLTRSVGALLDGGCDRVTVVLGAAADEVVQLFRAEWPRSRASPVGFVVAYDWAEGLSASLRAGLAALASTEASAAVIHLVDLPDVTSEVVRRFTGDARPDALLRATYHSRPGHPVTVGRAHWAAIGRQITADRGAGAYLAAHGAVLVECGDLATGADIDFEPRGAARRRDGDGRHAEKPPSACTTEPLSTAASRPQQNA